DMLVLPPSFPYGGMENPRMTFLTPTLLAGDRSLVDVVAHELAHSWTGDIVPNATMDHFWPNEGTTVLAERPEPGGAPWGGGGRHELGHRPEGARRRARAVRQRLAPDAAAHRSQGDRSGRCLLLGAVRERLAAPGAHRAHGGAGALRPLHPRLHREVPLHLDHLG